MSSFAGFVYTKSYPTETTYYTMDGLVDGSENPAWSFSLDIEKFASSAALGSDDTNDLVQIDFVLEAVIRGDIVITDNNSTATEYTWTFSTTVTFLDDFTDPTSDITLDVVPSLTNTVTVEGGDTWSSSVQTDPSVGSLSVTDQVYLDAYTDTDGATGTPETQGVNISVLDPQTSPWLTAIYPGGKNAPTLQTFNPEADFRVTVRYHTPEPGTLSLLGLIAAIGLYRRPKRC